MYHYDLFRHYTAARAMGLARRVARDDRGAASAEQIILVGAAVIGAAIVGGIIWSKMESGANSIQTPAP